MSTTTVQAAIQEQRPFMPARPVISSILVKPASADCNLHCTYCFYHDRPTNPYGEVRGRHVMDDATLQILIQEGMRLMQPSATFGWQGGEPMLTGIDFFKRVVEYEQQYGRSGQYVCNGVQTNGTLITDEWAQLFADYHFLLGVSLDGPPHLHDHYRITAGGQGTHELVLRGTQILDRHNAEYNILSVVNRLTADHAAEIWEYMQECDFRFLQFIPCVERDPATGQLTEFSVQPRQFGDFLCTVFDLWYNGGDPQVSVRLFDNLLLAYAGHGPQVCQFQKECGDYVVVEYNGDVYPCDFYVEDRLHLGNLHKTPLDEIATSKQADTFKRRKRLGDPACGQCEWLHICNHGCPLMRDHNPAGRTHYLCQAYQQFFAHSDERLRQLSQRVPAPPELPASQQTSLQGIGRNDPCPCGSGKKFKRCCGRRR